MQIVILVALLIVTLSLIGIILIQRSEGGGIGVGNMGGGNMGGLMSTRGASDLLTRTTGVLAALFMGLCLVLAILAARESKEKSILSKIADTETIELATLRDQAEGRIDAPDISVGTDDVATTEADKAATTEAIADAPVV